MYPKIDSELFSASFFSIFTNLTWLSSSNHSAPTMKFLNFLAVCALFRAILILASPTPSLVTGKGQAISNLQTNRRSVLARIEARTKVGPLRRQTSSVPYPTCDATFFRSGICLTFYGLTSLFSQSGSTSEVRGMTCSQAIATYGGE